MKKIKYGSYYISNVSFFGYLFLVTVLMHINSNGKFRLRDLKHELQGLSKFHIIFIILIYIYMVMFVFNNIILLYPEILPIPEFY